jgi:hypothetical protein
MATTDTGLDAPEESNVLARIVTASGSDSGPVYNVDATVGSFPFVVYRICPFGVAVCIATV